MGERLWILATADEWHSKRVHPLTFVCSFNVACKCLPPFWSRCLEWLWRVCVAAHSKAFFGPQHTHLEGQSEDKLFSLMVLWLEYQLPRTPMQHIPAIMPSCRTWMKISRVLYEWKKTNNGTPFICWALFFTGCLNSVQTLLSLHLKLNGLVPMDSQTDATLACDLY